MSEKLFESMDPAARRFYSRVFNTALLNMHAVRTGLYSTLLCETDDPLAMIRWRDAVPRVVMAIQERNQRGLGTDEKPEI